MSEMSDERLAEIREMAARLRRLAWSGPGVAIEDLVAEVDRLRGEVARLRRDGCYPAPRGGSVVVNAAIIDDADALAVEQGRYFIAYGEMVDGYRHAYKVVGPHRSTIRYSRHPNHPPDPRCPGCHPKESA